MNELRLQQEGEGAVIDGAPLPATYREAISWMVARNYLRSARYRDQCWRADTAGLDPDVTQFVQVFMRHMANIGIPVHADVAFISRSQQARLYVLGKSKDLPGQSIYNSGRAVSLVHSVRGRNLPAIAWRVFNHVGCEVAAKQGLGVQWGGSSAPWQWQILP